MFYTSVSILRNIYYSALLLAAKDVSGPEQEISEKIQMFFVGVDSETVFAWYRNKKGEFREAWDPSKRTFSDQKKS